MRRKRKKIGKYWVIIAFLVFLIVLGLLYNIINDNRKLTIVESLIKDTGLFIQKSAYAPVKFVQQQINEYREKRKMYEEYKDMKEKVESVELLKAKNEELEYQLKEMQKILELNNVLSKDSFLNATVINRNIGVWYDTITIDKGSKNGVKVDMPVIVKEGLIGKVIKTSNFNSTVKLLTSEDINNKISVKIKNGDDYILGLLVNYDLKNKVFIVEGIDQNVEIEPNSLVTTTGLGDYFPSGIIVGRVSNVRTDNFDLAKIVEVKSNVDFDQLNFVTILKREVEQQ
ncbi:MAG: rod shape-determining protein MreC [Mollicutes bacterium]|nr:rod shape-determining protein MreC [Mollicutes bacterium]